MGLLLMGCMPGGTTSNIFTYFSKGVLALSIMMTSVSSLVALLAVGGFVVWGLADGPSDIFHRISQSTLADWQLQPDRWLGLMFVSAAAVISLPRMFHVLVVEGGDESHLGRASWAFPAYLMLMSLFIIPIAVMGLERMQAAYAYAIAQGYRFYSYGDSSLLLP